MQFRACESFCQVAAATPTASLLTLFRVPATAIMPYQSLRDGTTSEMVVADGGVDSDTFCTVRVKALRGTSFYVGEEGLNMDSTHNRNYDCIPEEQ